MPCAETGIPITQTQSRSASIHKLLYSNLTSFICRPVRKVSAVGTVDMLDVVDVGDTMDLQMWWVWGMWWTQWMQWNWWTVDMIMDLWI